MPQKAAKLKAILVSDMPAKQTFCGEMVFKWAADKNVKWVKWVESLNRGKEPRITVAGTSVLLVKKILGKR